MQAISCYDFRVRQSFISVFLCVGVQFNPRAIQGGVNWPRSSLDNVRAGRSADSHLGHQDHEFASVAAHWAVSRRRAPEAAKLALPSQTISSSYRLKENFGPLRRGAWWLRSSATIASAPDTGACWFAVKALSA